MKNLRITSVIKDPESITPEGHFQLRVKFEITGTDGSDDSKVLFAGEYRPIQGPPGGRGVSIFSEIMHVEDGDSPWILIPFGEGRIPVDAEVAIWGMVDTDFKPYTVFAGESVANAQTK